MKKPTFADIARTAKVSTATVERVLNGRGGVRPETAERVVLAARKLDWPGRLPDKHRGILRIDVLLVRPETSFFRRLADAFRRIAATLDPIVQVHITFLEEADPDAIAGKINDRSRPRAGLVVSAPDTGAIRAALAGAMADGIPVVQVVTRSLPEAAFVGIDNYAAGRMAAMLMARMGAVQGTVAALCHSPMYGGHRDRIRGFSDYLSENAIDGPTFRFVGFGWDQDRGSAAFLRDALRDWPDLAGLYNAGGGNSAVLAELRKAGRPVFSVGHELTDTTRDALEDGTADVILDQIPEAQARRAIDLMLRAVGLVEGELPNDPIRFNTITRENL